MRGLTIVVVGEDETRFAAALALASAQAALGARATIYAHDRAVIALAAADRAMAAELGVRFVACQSGLAATGLGLPDNVEAGGLVSLLAELGDDRLVTL